MDSGVCLVMSVCTWFNAVLLVGTYSRGFIDCFPSGLFNIRVSVLGLVMLDFNDMRHIFTTGHRQPFNTAAYDILTLAVHPSYVFTSFPS